MKGRIFNLTSSRLPFIQSRIRIVVPTALLLILLSLVAPSLALYPAQTASAAPVYSVPAVSVTIPANGTKYLQVRGLAYQPGSTIPTGPLAFARQALPSDRVRISLYYGLDWGYADTNPQQVAYAIWWAQDGTWPAQDHSIAERIANAAAGAPGLPSWSPDGRSLVSLVAEGQLALSDLSLTPSSLSASAGTGVLAVRNTTGQDLLAYLPYGTGFNGSAGSALVWAVGVVDGPPAPPEATAPPAPAVTNVPEASPTPGSYKPGYTPPAEQTVVAPEATATASAPDPPESTATQVPGMPPVASQGDQSGDKSGKAASSGGSAAPAGGSDKAAPARPAEQASTTNSTQPEAPATQVIDAPPSTSDNTAPLPTVPSANTPVVPAPVSTARADAVTPVAPGPEQTKIAPIPAVTATPGGKAVDGQATPTVNVEATKQAELTPVIPKVLPTPVNPPDITVTTPQDAPGTVNTQTLGTGSQPNEIAKTGGGPSSLHAWLALFSAVLMLGGWSLRRIGAASPQPVEATADDSE